MNDQKKEIRVRIAPSPTGNLHIGTARAALFNWFFAKKHGGKFILRIEDTDRERSKKEYEADIFEGLRWLGLDWDEGPFVPLLGTQTKNFPPEADPPRAEKIKNQNYRGGCGPYRQSERGEQYVKYLKKLIDEKKAYYCFCSEEKLEAERKKMADADLAPKYSGTCRNLPPQEAARRQSAGEASVIRFKVSEESIKWDDIIRGRVSFDMTLSGDIVIAKDEHTALYNFAAVVDDFEMKISHVIRGEDHIGNTPKQIMLGRALGFTVPQFAHLPLILNADRSKMSKRDGATALAEYRRDYLSEAMINFLALLGWHPRGDKEVMNVTDIISQFELERVQKGGAVFNREKLDWLNGQYIKSYSGEALAQVFSIEPNRQNLKIIDLTRERMKRLSEFKELSNLFFTREEYAVELLAWKNAAEKQTKEILETIFEALGKIKEADFAASTAEQALLPFTDKYGRGEILWPLRVALSGRKASPGPYEILEALGQQESLERIKIAIRKLSNA